MTHLNELTITKPCPRCGNDLTVRVDGGDGRKPHRMPHG